ncbi:hypothetical protein [Streptomyces geranii]|nr:hypothetical protein [Streptomyces geranii]
MAIDPYALLRALLRAEAVRNAPKVQSPQVKTAEPQRPAKDAGH